MMNLGTYFNNIALKYPENKSLVFSNQNLSFKELNKYSNQIAAFLQKKGLNQGDTIALFLDKSIALYATMLACLKIGAPYVNLDISSPPKRLQKMLDTCKPKLALASSVFYKQFCIDLPEFKTNTIEYSKDFLIDISQSNKLNNFDMKDVSPDTIAYLMFTSGSTGFPKAVMIKHSSVLNFIQWTKNTYCITADDSLTNLNPMYFDNSVFDFYASIFNGASLIPISSHELKVPKRFIEYLNKVLPTIWFSVPSLLVYVLKMRALRETDLSSLRIMLFGGEGFNKTSLRELWSLLGSRVNLINVYGPTEGTCICSSYKVLAEDIIENGLLPLGSISQYFTFSIMDENMLEVQEGDIGELYLSGPNIALGYLNNSDKTQEAFKLLTVGNEKIIFYKTGDLVRYEKKSNLLYFCGRKDNQIKRMGYRIELEEIESALGSLENVIESAVIYIKNTDSYGEIVAFVNSKEENENQIIKRLREYIPSYMLPNKVIFMKQLPKNQNGKINRLNLEKHLKYD